MEMEGTEVNMARATAKDYTDAFEKVLKEFEDCPDIADEKIALMCCSSDKRVRELAANIIRARRSQTVVPEPRKERTVII